MDYRKTIKLYEEDGKTVMCDFDIVLNRSMAVVALRDYPTLLDVLFNGAGFNVEGEDPIDAMLKIIDEGNADKFFAISDDMPNMLKCLFPKMLDAGQIRVGDRDDIIELCNECLEFNTDFLKGISNFFMTALHQNATSEPKRKIPKFTMN